MSVHVFDDPSTHEAIAAVVAGMPEFRAAAAKVHAEVVSEAASHADSGKLASSIDLKQGKVDWRIEAGTDYDAHAEFGHYTYYDANGQFTSAANAVRKQWVDGIHVFRNVVAANGGL
jgi:hypothetical protein